jgi:CrcB protein
MKNFIVVAVGGAIGACARYSLSGFVLHRTFQHRFPLGTFTVNILGCLLAGIVMGLAEKHKIVHHELRLFLITGILGGFTTFSAFGIETAALLKRGDIFTAAEYIMLTVLVGFLAMWIAYSYLKN